MRRKLLAGLLAWVMLFSLLPANALAEGETAAAQIGEMRYETLDEAVEAAEPAAVQPEAEEEPAEKDASEELPYE